MSLDPVSHLLLDEAALEPSRPPAPARPAESRSRVAPSVARGPLLVIDDPALAGHLHGSGHPVRAYCDDLRDERELALTPLTVLDDAALAGVTLVLMRLPKSLGMLEDYAQRVAAFAGPGVRLLAGGREKHLTRSMNEVLGRSFQTVRASLGRQKSRVLHATDPTPGDLSWPHTTTLDDLTLVSHAGAFAADRLDGGTRLLLNALSQSPPHPSSASTIVEDHPTHRGLAPRVKPSTRTLALDVVEPAGEDRVRAVDLGCGTGILATWLARQGHHVLAVDVSLAACASARDTAAANGVRVDVHRADRLDVPPSSVDLVVCNPPFHRGTTKDSTPGFDLIRSAIPALAPGAEFWTVFNSHLPYLPFLRAEIGPTQVLTRDRSYTVTRSLR